MSGKVLVTTDTQSIRRLKGIVKFGIARNDLTD